MFFSLQILLEIFFPEDNLIRFEMCAIWDVPGKNNNDENKKGCNFPSQPLLFIVLSKNGMNEMITIGKGCKQHKSN